MSNKFWFRAVPVVCCTLFALIIFGCATWQAGNTTKIVESQNQLQPIEYIPLPPEVTGRDDPNSPWYGKVIVMPTTPGKDVDFEQYYASGQLAMKLKTRKSDVITAQFGGVITADAAKYAADLAQAQLLYENLQMLIDKALSFVQSQAATKQAATATAGSLCNPDGSCTESFKSQLKGLVLEALGGQTAKK
jgi:hypothetical protein